MDGVESPGGRIGAVLAAPRSGVVRLGPHQPWLVTTPAQARRVMTDVASFDFPGDVSRSGDLSASRGETRSGHTVFAPLAPEQVALGVATFETEWTAALDGHDRDTPHEPYDAMELLRRPVSRATCAAVLPTVALHQRDLVADRVLDWIDALAPVISSARPPRRWSRVRRVERDARHAVEDALERVTGLPFSPQEGAVLLAAGIQVPIAAGAWLLAWTASCPPTGSDPVHVAWETLRLTPPTWITARVTTTAVDLDGQPIPAGSVVLVSPLLLGRLDELVPQVPTDDENDDLAAFRPERWATDAHRPGAWLPFGAGPHSCPGRSLGLALLVRLAEWTVDRHLTLTEAVGIDQSRGLSPAPCRFTARARTETTS